MTQAPTQLQTDTAVHCRNITKDFGHGESLVRALDNVSVGFRRGSFTAIMGPSGSGKSTLMHCLAGLDTVTTGEVWVGNDPITGRSDKFVTEIRRDRIGFIFQSFNLLPTLKAADNITLPLELAGRKVDQARVQELANTLGIGNRLDHLPSQLSGGQQQRVAVARALIGQPDVLFADEPTGALDSHSGQQLLSILRTASREAGQTIVMVTHDPIAASYADRVVLLRDGRIAGELDNPTADSVIDAMRKLGV
ncbi:ATP-binding cassette domain-containing protein [Epidermidibacterium keratini]|uniref:ATP-binding cassette domain-containing protein n=1 Tax=Epidermidibacterium keratini TaxID=1891644 RepID=A0A7L4YNV0_9ACTN|nr:ABC transporter ATP-binding protein [Epidermidibacterium keratini]QHC00227.1 ATP-binding cassette domain-containing protein [Epidermidibacterium keratini]